MKSDGLTSREEPRRLSRAWLWTLLALSATTAAVTLWIVRHTGPPEVEVVEQVLEGEEALAAGVYRHEVIDAITRRRVTALEGRRYRVRIEEDAGGSAGIARIGGLVTFVSGARKGEVCIAEVTRVKKTVAEAVRIRTESPADDRDLADPLTEARRDDPVRVGGIYTGYVAAVGQEGDGIVRVNGKVVFVSDVTVGEQIRFRVVENLDRFARGVRIGPQSEQPPANPSQVLDGRTASAADVQEGRLFDVLIEEADRLAPERDGVTRIDGLVVFVSGARPDEHARIRIVRRFPRFARAEVVQKLQPPSQSEGR